MGRFLTRLCLQSFDGDSAGFGLLQRARHEMGIAGLERESWMRASNEYSEYLRSFGTTFPLYEMHHNPSLQGIGLRHDVDYDLEAALAIGRAEAALGCRSTYFLLHTAPYWGKAGFSEACQELEKLGHEVGLHLNVLAEWYDGRINDPEGRLIEVSNQLRATGIRVTGCAAHGDPLCYAGAFSNHWLLRELRGNDPAASESGISAEGIRDDRVRFQLHYPVNHELVSRDGRGFPLWSATMSAAGIQYHAVHVFHDRYFSDSGGNWTRTADPLKHPYEGGRWQVLMHPEYWMAPPRILVSFGSLAETELSLATRQGYFPISASKVATAIKKSVKSPRRLRKALADVQRQMPKSTDALIYGVPVELRELLGGKESGGSRQTSWISGDNILLEASPSRRFARRGDSGNTPFHGVVEGRHAAVLPTVDGLAVRFERRGSRKLNGSVVYLENAKGSFGGFGNWRVCLDVEAERAGAALYIDDRSADSAILSMPAFILSKLLALVGRLRGLRGRRFRRVTSLPPGKRRITFCYGQMSDAQGFVPAIQTSDSFEGRVHILSLWIEPATDRFFAAEPLLESIKNLEL